MSTVSCVKVSKISTSPNIIFDAVKKAMELNHWEKYVRGKKIILKVNVMWDQLYPSCTTTPMVVEGVIKTILTSAKFADAKITIVDSNTVSFMDASKSFRVQGFTKLVQKYNNVEVTNLSRTKFKTVSFKQATILKKIKISEVLLQADTIITIPVPKTHAYSVMTGALKNQWGCIHELRHNYHLVLHPAIVDINQFLSNKLTFAVMDALFAMEGKGPKNGIPRQIGYVLASNDLVALDSVACQMIGLDAKKIRYIKLAETRKLGKMKPNIVGDQLPSFKFATAQKSNFAMGMEMKIRKISPLVEKLFFNESSPILLLLRIAAKFYYDFWYQFIGMKNVKKMLKTNYGVIWKKHYLQ